MPRLSRLRERLDAALPKASMSVATLALVVASAGGAGAYAAAKIGTGDLKNNAVTTAKIKNGNVTRADLSPKVRTQSWVWQPGAPLETTWPANGVVNLGTRTIKVAAPGLLDADVFGASVFDSSAVMLALLDFKGSIPEGGIFGDADDPEEVVRLLDSIVAISDGPLGNGFTIPQRVGAGKHTIRWVAVNPGGTPGDPVTIAFRKLVASYTPGVSGKEQRWTFPELPEVARKDLLRQLAG